MEGNKSQYAPSVSSIINEANAAVETYGAAEGVRTITCSNSGMKTVREEEIVGS
jgi:hypothetical protein